MGARSEQKHLEGSSAPGVVAEKLRLISETKGACVEWMLLFSLLFIGLKCVEGFLQQCFLVLRTQKKRCAAQRMLQVSSGSFVPLFSLTDVKLDFYGVVT